ncbi:MAG TPA: hypothetical protein DDW65_24620 [Firmicutes bacterium]|nr:hypothetical protein [Bacillota bacterium]
MSPIRSIFPLQRRKLSFPCRNLVLNSAYRLKPICLKMIRKAQLGRTVISRCLIGDSQAVLAVGQQRRPFFGDSAFDDDLFLVIPIPPDGSEREVALFHQLD